MLPQAVLSEKHEAVLQRLHKAEAALAHTTRDYILGTHTSFRLSCLEPASLHT